MSSWPTAKLPEYWKLLSVILTKGAQSRLPSGLEMTGTSSSLQVFSDDEIEMLYSHSVSGSNCWTDKKTFLPGDIAVDASRVKS